MFTSALTNIMTGAHEGIHFARTCDCGHEQKGRVSWYKGLIRTFPRITSILQAALHDASLVSTDA